ncbi:MULTISPECIES: type II toxin-antitoxin system Phd/YefM family antitoxin [unclassified Streptomyces]|uniref:type II toxin-antitoxin system Phd/YefM family antitoxin n=1 Tax=unclassified Streptomyces TaxID=2593676 RepID=UPI00226E4AF4|nr:MULTISPECIES: type II toxin-antitoxin system Phd/YefM family antitoxin [unclassified Streptomyces]MCY0924558.1 type II toxin-antitoxin system Phd/YefM family antitoxin [Streptomyces sp. H27-G5]MCY0963026.1 type II toxin-antitoxin system Phd/YefM family antitoxin [Streptomyces sp. H27-H5]
MAMTPQTTFPVTEARACLGDLARRASAHEHITLTERGRPTAVLISPEELEGLEDSLALARLELSRARGDKPTPVSNDAARRVFLNAAGLTEDPR